MIALLLFVMLQPDLDRAQSLLREGKIDEAQQAVSAALQRHPDSVDALTLQGRLAMARDQFDLARRSFERAAELAPASAQVQFLLGFFHYVDNDFVRALPVLEHARKLAPHDARTALFLALTHDGLAAPADAERLFQEALRLEARAKRRTAESHVAYARMLFTAGRFAEAEAQIKQALTVEPNSREAHYEQARLDLEAGRIAGAIENGERALRLEGTGVTPRQIHFLLSRAYSQNGDHPRAGQHRAKFEAIPPRLIR